MQKFSPPPATLLISGLTLLLIAGVVFLPPESAPDESSDVYSPPVSQVADVVFQPEEPSGYLMDLQVPETTYYISKTSGTVGSLTTVGSCITYNGGSGQFSYYYYQVSSGGVETLKYSGTQSGYWPGCIAGVVFTVSANSKVRAEVVGNTNTGIHSIHQFNHW